ncbi:hypothetical protein GCM10009069_01250 [Algimonas arctica]|uniref:Uncharacterized protein n=1 Tax=Algimonas arctica TaxID=1479486 RepID=A0A8J3CK97_9PROT|nr:hypothetical protein [Algimonas arctica]GHA81921.1 hypothetical protein GCM10009069_01250 [Algimonas arctica]
MNEKLRAIWRLSVAVLLYPLALAALIWIWWTGKPAVWGVAVMVVVLMVDRTWLFLLRQLFSRRR